MAARIRQNRYKNLRKEILFKIMFVCMGNVCRSPLAHVLLENYLKTHKLSEKIKVESSGVNVFNEGQRACENIRAVSAAKGVPFDHYSRRFSPADLKEYDLILAMDEETMYRIKKLTKNKQLRGKVSFFRDYDPVKDGSREVPDPWYGSTDQSELVFEMIERTIGPLSEAIGNN